MKYKKIILLILIYFLKLNNLHSEEIVFKSENIQILDQGNVIRAFEVEAEIKSKKIFISGKNSVYRKKIKELTMTDRVKVNDDYNDIILKGDKLIYNIDLDIFKSKGKIFINVKNKYDIYSKNLIFNRKENIIFSNNETTIKDRKGNVLNLEKKFRFNLDEEIISSNKINLIDNNNNNFSFNEAKINLKTNEIVGKDLKIDFVDNYFGNPKNDPKLRGKSVISNDDETKVYKVSFSTCNTENKNCPGWEIQSEEFQHDKKNKLFNYKNSWIKLFDKEIFYFPFFSHPDPTVKRKSGFLAPYYGSSNNFGSWINIPYFKTMGKDKDMTFNPRFYADDKFILQSEYRQSFNKSFLTSDFSYNNDGKNSNTHLFAKLSGDIDKSSKFKFNYQSVSNDDYLKIHNLSNFSSLIDDESLLTSQFNYSKIIDKNTALTTDFIVFEDLSKSDNDRFQYILPNFTFIKDLELDETYNGNFQFQSSGFQKNYDTNKYEALLINDFLFNSKNLINDLGLVSNYDLLIKNSNSYSENSTLYDDKEEYEVFGSFLYKLSLPMKKSTVSSNNYIKPIASFRYSPNNTKDISNKDTRLSYDNIFSLNRIGTREIVEGGKSISLGFEFEKRDPFEKKLLSLSIANSLRDRINSNLPLKSKLNEKRSDVVGKASFIPNNILNFDYNFSYDNNLKSSNYDSISTNFNYGFFSTSFNFLSEDENIGNNEVVSNYSKIKLDDENSLKFNITKDLKADFTEYYNLIYDYQTDCLKASLEYNKKFYSDGNLKPEKNIFFSIKFIPFTGFRQEAGFKN